MAWYYLLNKSAPTKIANLQMATSPNFQKQIVRDLKKKNVKFILYQSYSWDNIEHIEKYGSHHTDGIISQNVDKINTFVEQVDSAVITVNSSTRLSDGGVFGLGAEIGISTDKLHARGPMGIRDLTTYKWVVRGNGDLRF